MLTKEIARRRVPYEQVITNCVDPECKAGWVGHKDTCPKCDLCQLCEGSGKVEEGEYDDHYEKDCICQIN